MLLGCIADDFTGATDLANTLVRYGMRTVQLLGVPEDGDEVPDADAVVVALKSRTTPAQDAIDESVAALHWLQDAGCQQFFFKYCSTFDSTADGNIGPVADALLDELESDFTIACPAFPENARTIFKGHLFVGDVLLNQSGMENHPLTPMTDANLVRVLQSQTSHKVGLVKHDTVASGVDAVLAACQKLVQEGYRHAIVDAVTDADLEVIGEACAGLKLITGGSGVALGLPANFRSTGALQQTASADALPQIKGASIVLAGSCSTATLAQVENMKATCPAFRIDPDQLAEGVDVAQAAIEFAASKMADGPVLVYSSAAADQIQAVQAKLGREVAGSMIEKTLASIATSVVADHGVRRIVVAGGETSGAVVTALGIKGLRIGPQIDPGVPWTTSLGDPELALALKSGNFGSEDFFLKSLRQLDQA